MKILVISSVFPPFKAAEADYALRFCEQLVEQGHEIVILTSRGVSAELPATTVYPVMARWSWRELPRLYSILRRESPQAVVLLYIGWMYGWHPMMTFLPTIARWAVPCARVATIFYNRYGARRAEATLRSLILHRAMRALSGDRRLIYEYGSLLTHSNNVLALSNQHGEVFRTVLPSVAGRLRILPSLPLLRFCRDGRDKARANGRMALGIAPDEFLITFFGYLYPSKGVETLFEALSLLIESGIAARLILIGGVIERRALDETDYLAELKTRAVQLAISDKLIWTGAYESESEDASRWLYCADAAALPFDDGISLNNSSVAAVMWHELPLVSTMRADLEVEFRHDDNVLLCPPRDPAALAAALTRLCRDNALARRLGRSARNLAGRVFSWQNAIQQVTAVMGASDSATNCEKAFG